MEEINATPSGRLIAGYARVSTEEQGRLGYSMDVQAARLQACAQWRFPGEQFQLYSDVGSGRNDNRPGFKALRNALIHDTIGALIVLDLDRLARSASAGWAFLRECETRNVVVIVGAQSIDSSTPAGRHFLRSLLSTAEFESDMISERVRRTVAYQKARGRKGPGLRPYGYNVDPNGYLTPNEREQAAIRMAVALRAQGQGWANVAAALNSAGFLTVSGVGWSPEGCRSVMVRAARATAEADPNQGERGDARAKTIAHALHTPRTTPS